MKRDKSEHAVTRTMPRWVWWKRGGCTIEVLRTGHFPTTIIGKLPDDNETEIEIEELELYTTGVEIKVVCKKCEQLKAELKACRKASEDMNYDLL